jgi:hypothetical protein
VLQVAQAFDAGNGYALAGVHNLHATGGTLMMTPKSPVPRRVGLAQPASSNREAANSVAWNFLMPTGKSFL